MPEPKLKCKCFSFRFSALHQFGWPRGMWHQPSKEEAVRQGGSSSYQDLISDILWSCYSPMLLLMDLKVTEILKSLDRLEQNIDQHQQAGKKNKMEFQKCSLLKTFFVCVSTAKKVFQPSFHQNKNLSQIKILEVFLTDKKFLRYKTVLLQCWKLGSFRTMQS